MKTELVTMVYDSYNPTTCERYCLYSNGSYAISKYDKDGNEIYYKDSMGNWDVYLYDKTGKPVFHDSNDGVIFDYRNQKERTI